MDQYPILRGAHNKFDLGAAPLMLYVRWHMLIADNFALSEENHNSLGGKQSKYVRQTKLTQ